MHFAAACLAAVFIMSVAGCSGEGTPLSESERLFRLAHMNGCVECHVANVSTVGPSWNAVSERYKDIPLEDAKAALMVSMKHGSRGKWPSWKSADGMPPLEGRVSEEHMEQLLDYILPLKR